MSKDLLQRSPQAFVEHLQERGIRRLHFVRDDSTGRLLASHDFLQPIADFISDDPRDFLGHEGIFLQVSREHCTLQGAFVHLTRRGQAAGGVRYWNYATLEDYLRDGLRLSVGMTRKNALAGLWWGGGKGVMARNPQVERDDPDVRRTLYREYGELMTALRGCYVTAEDVGTSVEDMEEIFRTTRFTTCIPPSLGGSGNPSIPTARGVLAGIEAALEYSKLGPLHERSVAVQGIGHVGGPLVGLLLERGVKRIIACDVDSGLIESRRREFAQEVELRLVEREDESIFGVECDILAPCATGAILNPRTIPLLRAKIVCGAANNQLEDASRDDHALRRRGILYVPDFLTNRMGIVTCADESSGYVTPDPAIERHLRRDWDHSIHRTALEVFSRADATGSPTSAVATEIADRLAQESHPILGHRGASIIRSLVENRWFEG